MDSPSPGSEDPVVIDVDGSSGGESGAAPSSSETVGDEESTTVTVDNIEAQAPTKELSATNCDDLALEFGRGLNDDVLSVFETAGFEWDDVWMIHMEYLNGAGSANYSQKLECRADEFLDAASAAFSTEFKQRVYEYMPVPETHPQQFAADYDEWYSIVLDSLDTLFSWDG
jgi:hypothetical protein